VSLGFPEEDLEVDIAFSIDVDNALEANGVRDLLRWMRESVWEAMIG